MLCGNTQAEIDRDTQTDAQEQAQYAAEQARWKLIFNELLEGATIEENGRKYNLDEYLKNKYYGEFQFFADNDIDLLDFFSCGKDLGGFFKAEARVLASIIVG